jgi:hypothetical protein
MMKQIVLAALLASTATMAYAQMSPASRDATPPSTAAAERTVSTGDFDKNGNMSGGALIGTKVKNANNDTVGSINDIYLDKDGSVKMVVISVGGFLGVGSKAVAVKWSDIVYGKDGDSLKLSTNLSKEALTGMPDFTVTERRKPAPPVETASPPPASKR